MSEEIRQNFDELVSVIINHSKYPIEWMLKLGIADFYSHVRLINKALKQK